MSGALKTAWLTAALAAVACLPPQKTPGMDSKDAKPQTDFRLSSLHIHDGKPLRPEYACSGPDNLGRSPDLRWTPPPEGTTTLVVTVVDISADEFVHWALFDVPVSTHGLPEATQGPNLPEGAFELNNDFGKTGYGGPCPPEGDPAHIYVFSVYALDRRPPDIRPGTAPPKDLDKTLRSAALASGRITVHYQR